MFANLVVILIIILILIKFANSAKLIAGFAKMILNYYVQNAILIISYKKCLNALVTVHQDILQIQFLRHVFYVQQKNVILVKPAKHALEELNV